MDLLRTYPTNYNPYLSFAPRSQVFGPANSAFGQPLEIQTILSEVVQALTQLTRAWSNMGGPGQYGPVGGDRRANSRGISPSSSLHDPTPANQLQPPVDPKEFASYLQMQVKGGALQGSTTVREADAIPGTNLAKTEDPTLWNAGVARAYTYQFAAQAAQDNYNTPRGTYDPLTAEGLQNGVSAFNHMTPEAQLFTQVASVYKGNLLDGPGNYDNAALGNLLLTKAQTTGDSHLAQLAYGPNVGQTDVQTIGAITNALNGGKISLNDIVASGAIPPQNMARYQQVISYVSNGAFNQDLGKFDANFLTRP